MTIPSSGDFDLPNTPKHSPCFTIMKKIIVVVMITINKHNNYHHHHHDPYNNIPNIYQSKITILIRKLESTNMCLGGFFFLTWLSTWWETVEVPSWGAPVVPTVDDIFTYIYSGWFLMVNVGKHTIHGFCRVLLMVQKSCVHQLSLVVHPIICRVLPSEVVGIGISEPSTVLKVESLLKD